MSEKILAAIRRLRADETSLDSQQQRYDDIYNVCDACERLAQEHAQLTAWDREVGPCAICGHSVKACNRTTEARENSPIWHTWCYYRARIATLRAALEKYGRHDENCPAGFDEISQDRLWETGVPVACRCGLAAALAKDQP